jgi:hypothetical protein
VFPLEILNGIRWKIGYVEERCEKPDAQYTANRIGCQGKGAIWVNMEFQISNFTFQKAPKKIP